MAGGEIREVEGLGAVQGGSAGWAPGSRRTRGGGHSAKAVGQLQNSAPFGPCLSQLRSWGWGGHPWPHEPVNAPAFLRPSLAVGPFVTEQVWKKRQRLPRRVLLVPVGNQEPTVQRQHRVPGQTPGQTDLRAVPGAGVPHGGGQPQAVLRLP